MAKLYEIAELLTEELHNFEQSVKHLEQERQALQKYKLKPDTSDVDFLLKGYNHRQRKIIEEQNQLIRNLAHRVNYALILPNWFVRVFWIWCFLNLAAACITIYLNSNWSEREEIAFQKGQEKYTRHFKEFFDQHPEALNAYRDWLKESEQ